jgi:hypothetical protein
MPVTDRREFHKMRRELGEKGPFRRLNGQGKSVRAEQGQPHGGRPEIQDGWRLARWQSRARGAWRLLSAEMRELLHLACTREAAAADPEKSMLDGESLG